MFHNLEKIRLHGYTPDTILDIGAYKGLWTSECKRVFPDAMYYLFEAIPYQELEGCKNTSKTLVFHAVLDETEREVDWYERQNTGDSMFKERTSNFQDCFPVKRLTVPLCKIIDPYVPLMKNVLVKIDCQGAEIPILKGAGEILQKADFVLLELPFFGQYNEGVPSFLEHIQYMDSIGYTPFDILEIHNNRGFTIQVDVLFISKKHQLNQRVQQVLME